MLKHVMLNAVCWLHCLRRCCSCFTHSSAVPHCKLCAQVGNGLLTFEEQRSHFALWALLKAPLIISADLRSVQPASLAILTAHELIAVNQDPLGIPADLIWKQGPYEVWGPWRGSIPLAKAWRVLMTVGTVHGMASKRNVNS